MKHLLLAFALVLSSPAFAADTLFNCVDSTSGEPVFVKSNADHSVNFTFQRPARSEKSTTDIFAARDTYTLIGGQLDQDGEALVQDLCPQLNSKLTVILNVNDKLQKRFCLSCVVMQNGRRSGGARPDSWKHRFQESGLAPFRTR